jgi:two-component system response regulator LytT
MNVIIIEDEQLAANRLEKYLLEINPDIVVLAKIESIKESVQWLMHHTADLIFLDIQLSDGISFSIFEQITVRTPIVFTTAYDKYAIEAFQVNSISYLLKPIRKNDLSESLKKYKELKSVFAIDFDEILSAVQGVKSQFRKRFLIQVGENFRRIEIEQIAYFYAYEKAVYLKTKDGKSYPADATLDNLEKNVDTNQFFRINRKFLVNINAIEKMYTWSRCRIKLSLKPQPEDDSETIVSIDRATDFKRWMNK